MGLLYLSSKYLLVKFINSYQFQAIDEAIVIAVLILSTLIVLFSFYTYKNSTIIYVEKIQENTLENTTNSGDVQKSDKLQLDKFTSELNQIEQSEGSIQQKIEKTFNLMCSAIQAGQGVLYQCHQNEEKVSLVCSYAFVAKENQITSYQFGEGLIGLSAKENRTLKLDNIPEGYINVFSGLGSSSPSYIYIIPFSNNSSATIGILEVALFKDLTVLEQEIIEKSKSSFCKSII
ncbi:MAG: hypothetical protein EAZ07_08045 [Cytophagales bacterium]|nr:MAG: hypothetical protein EAZ07_08045 [Cytophagales bacterium]